MSVKDVLKKASEHLQARDAVLADLEIALLATKKRYREVNDKIQSNNAAKNAAEDKVKECIANIHSKGFSKESFPALDAARAELDKVSKDAETEVLIKSSESIQYEISELEEVIEKVR